ncbi:MAG: response regulator [Desulforhopalus sp.]
MTTMNQPSQFSIRQIRQLIILGSGIIIIAFIVSGSLYIKNADNRDREQFQNHATIITDDIWALNPISAQTYLALAVKAGQYKRLDVSIPGDESFLQINSPPLTGLSQLLYDLKLIGIKKLKSDIIYHGERIGTLSGEQYIRVIYPLLNIFVFLALMLLTGIFIIYLSSNRRFLEQQVLERTRNLRESERRFHDLVTLLPEMVLETDLDGNIIYANKAAEDTLGLIGGKGRQSNFFDMIIEEERKRAREDFRSCLIGTPSPLKEFTVSGRGSKSFPVLMRSAPIMSGPILTGARSIVIDISERRQLQKQLHRDSKMKAIGLMAGGVAHDLNNIISGIISYPELMLLDLEEDSPLRRPLKAIHQSGLDASDVVSDLLTVARGIAAKTEILNANELIKDYLSSRDFKQLQEDYPLVGVNTSLSTELQSISCSPIHFRKCLMNLSTNGMEAIAGTGQLSITTEPHQQSTTLEPPGKNNLAAGDYVKIIFHDSGTGIGPDEIDHLFEPFYTKKVMGRSGTGLGLAVVWNTMQDHGGVVTVTSNSHGTYFTLYFPCVDAPNILLKKQDDMEIIRGCGETILVIDDEERQRDIAGDLLASLGYKVETAASGEAAVDFLKSHAVDLLVLDMIMSPGQNGFVTYQQILNLHPGQKALIASGFAEDGDVRATLALGAGGFISKPYTMQAIGSAIGKILHQ